jgi:hypothetical protein
MRHYSPKASNARYSCPECQTAGGHARRLMKSTSGFAYPTHDCCSGKVTRVGFFCLTQSAAPPHFGYSACLLTSPQCTFECERCEWQRMVVRKARVIARQKRKRKMGLGFHVRRRRMWSEKRQLRQLILALESLVISPTRVVRKDSP